MDLTDVPYTCTSTVSALLEVLADRGFLIDDILMTKGVKLTIPPFTRKCNNAKGKRLNVSEIRKTREIVFLMLLMT